VRDCALRGCQGVYASSMAQGRRDLYRQKDVCMRGQQPRPPIVIKKTIRVLQWCSPRLVSFVCQSEHGRHPGGRGRRKIVGDGVARAERDDVPCAWTTATRQVAHVIGTRGSPCAIATSRAKKIDDQHIMIQVVRGRTQGKLYSGFPRLHLKECRDNILHDLPGYDDFWGPNMVSGQRVYFLAAQQRYTHEYATWC